MGLVGLSGEDLELLVCGGRSGGPTRKDVISVGDWVHASDRRVQGAVAGSGRGCEGGEIEKNANDAREPILLSTSRQTRLLG